MKQPNSIETILSKITLGEDWRQYCWVWGGELGKPIPKDQRTLLTGTHSGNAVTSLGSKTYNVHRLLWQVFRADNNQLTAYDELSRLCGYSDCVCPAHWVFNRDLYSTIRQNQQDQQHQQHADFRNEHKREVCKRKTPFSIACHPSDLLFPHRRTIALLGGHSYKTDALKTIEQTYDLDAVRQSYYQTYQPDLPPLLTLNKIYMLHRELTQEEEQWKKTLTVNERQEYSRLLTAQVKERLGIPSDSPPGENLYPPYYARYAQVSEARATFLIERAYLMSEQYMREWIIKQRRTP